MTRLVLIRHARPEIDTGVPPSAWRLSDAGIADTTEFATTTSDLKITRIVASHEPKASQTAAVLSQELNIPWSSAPGLHEHERDKMQWLGEADWNELLREFFANPDRVVFGRESAADARARFAAAVDGIVSAREMSADRLAIVAHGTVISLYAADILGRDPYALWRSLGMPGSIELNI